MLAKGMLARSLLASRTFAVQIIGANYGANQPKPGPEKAPDLLRSSGLIDSIKELGRDYVDRGNVITGP